METLVRTTSWRAILCGLAVFLIQSCSAAKNSSTAGPDAPLAPANLSVGPSLTGSGVSKGSVTVTTHTFTSTRQSMVRFNDAWGGAPFEIDLGSFNQAVDFGGQNGSITLVAETQNYPLSGGAYPILTEFRVVPADGSAEIRYVNLAAQCNAEGMYDCTGGNCTAHATCLPLAGQSAFFNRTDWDQHQIPPLGYATTNSFPRCDSTIAGWANCPASKSSLVSGHYYATYVLLSNSGSPVSSYTASLKLTARIKKDTSARNALASNGGVNVNVILVGDKNITDAHTSAGGRNLQLLFNEVNHVFATTGANIGINQIKTYEWSNANGGDQYADVSITALAALFQRGSAGVDANDSGSAINVFLVSNIQSSNANYSILGLAGGILGPPVNGTGSSGLAFATFNQLAGYNPGCASVTCARTYLESGFLEVGSTISHEIGHFLGLNHPTENSPNLASQLSDQLNDTPTCAHNYSASIGYFMNPRTCYYLDTTTQVAPLSGSCRSACDAVTGATPYLTGTKLSSAVDPWGTDINTDIPRKFCPSVQACQHNHVMWFTTKSRHLVKTADGVTTCSANDVTNGLCIWSEDGNLFSPESQALIQWGSFVQ